MNTFLRLTVPVLLFAAPLMGQQIGKLTMLEGELRVIRGTALMQGLEGIRLNRGDILETASPGFAQLEFAGGAIVLLGPNSHLLLLSHSAPNRAAVATSGTRAELVLLNGWLKGEDAAKSGMYRYDTPWLAGIAKDGTVVLHAAGESSEVFIESGTATIAQLTEDGNTSHSSGAKAGQFCSRQAGKKLVVSDRPSANFVNSVPPPFRDTLPSRLSRFSNKRIAPKRLREVSYSDIRPWLIMAPEWRKDFVTRFQPRLDDAGFREEIESHLEDHPEWDAALHPAKYSSKQGEPSPRIGDGPR